MNNKKTTVDIMANAITSTIKEYDNLKIKPKMINFVLSSSKPLNQKKGDIWLQTVDSVGSLSSDNINDTPVVDVAKVSWESILNKPTTYPPSAHTHAWDSITDKPQTFIPSAHTHEVVWSDIQQKPETFSPTTHQHEWSEVINKPATYPPSVHSHNDYSLKEHSHNWNEINNTPVSYPPSEHSHSFENVTNKPIVYPPSEHNHEWGSIQNKPETFTPSSHLHNEYANKTHSHSWSSITDKPEVFTPSAHSHSEYALTEHTHTQYANSVHMHNIASSTTDGFLSKEDKDKIDEYAGDIEKLKRDVSNLSVGSVNVDWDDIANKPTSYTPTEHIHQNATPLSDGFMSKEDKEYLDGLYVPSPINNLTSESITIPLSAKQGKVLNEKITNHTHSDATISKSGFMSSDDKTKLNGIEIGATKNVGENNLTSTSTVNYLTAYQGKVLNEKINNIVTNKVNVIDNLTSESVTSALSANQGRVLKDEIDSLSNDTGWVNCMLSSNFENYADDQILRIRRIGKLVELRGAVKVKTNITGSSNMNAVITTLDDIFIPSQRIVTSSVGTGVNMQLFSIYPNGNVTLLRYINMANGTYTTVTNAMWVQLQTTWFVD